MALINCLNLFDASVGDLNPHQNSCGTFALNNPLSKGVVPADEVGLGKPLEAGFSNVTQHWAERKRRILIICPASLRRQWRRNWAISLIYQRKCLMQNVAH